MFFLHRKGQTTCWCTLNASAKLVFISTSLGNKMKQLFLVSLALRLIFFILICSIFFFFVEKILLRHDRTIMDSFEAIWPLSLTLKAQHLLVLDVKLNPLMISSLPRSHEKFLLDYIVGKSFELDIELKQTFCLWTPKVWLYPTASLLLLRSAGNIQKGSTDSGHWLEWIPLMKP